jgi:salicylate hydroxylase
LYPFDAEADTLQRWPEVSAQVMKELDVGKIEPLFARTSALHDLETA